MFASGIGLRAKEGLSSDNSVLIQASLKSYYAEHFDGTLDKGSVVAGDPDYLKLCFLDDLHPLIQEAAWFSLSVSDRELDRRIALNQYLAGETRESFVKTQTPSDYGMAQWGPQRPDKLESREHAFDQDQIDPLAEIRYFKVKYIVLAAGSHPPPKLLPYVKKIKSGPWDIYSLSL
jgi:hypothetical protein